MTIDLKPHTHFNYSCFGEFGVLQERVDDRRQQQGLLPRQGEDSQRRHCNPESEETGKCFSRGAVMLSFHFLIGVFALTLLLISDDTTGDRDRRAAEPDGLRLRLQRGRSGVRVPWRACFLKPASGFASIYTICETLLWCEQDAVNAFDVFINLYHNSDAA